VNANTVSTMAEATSMPLRLMRPNQPLVALGLAVNYMMRKPAFANQRFGEWSRILAGQVNRKHYYFAVDAENRIQGFIGWLVTTKDKAEAWIEGRQPLGEQDANEGDCIVFNAWAANNGRVNRFLVDAARTIIVGKDTCYFKRYYADGSVRPAQLRVNDFVTGHLAERNEPPPS